LGLQARAIGPFGFQPDNSATRRVEYPWAFFAVPVNGSHTVIDLGGSLGGLQFVLSRAGARVITVDPAERAAMGWPVDATLLRRLNRAFGTSVELRKCFLADAGFADESVDRVYCVSTLEHVPYAEALSMARDIARVLRPGGFAVLTIDLFYDLAPFTSRPTNVHGRNLDIRELVEASGLELHAGERSELCGYPEFDPQEILSRAMDFVQGDTALNTAQCLALRKPPAAGHRGQ
jgi:SAM-dependent methyltransferase